MKNNDYNIDDLFEIARKEKPLISKEEVREIIPDYNLPAGNFLNTKIFKGDKKMYSILSASAVAISVILMNIFNFDDNSSKNQSVQNQVRPLSANTKIQKDNNYNRTFALNNSNSDVKKSGKSEKIQNQSEPNVLLSDNKVIVRNENPQTKEKTELFDNSNKDIKGIKSIKLNENELKDLGISVDEKGSFIEVFMSRKRATPTKIFVDWGIGDNSEDIPSDKPDNFIIPRMITDNRGMRRIEVFSDNNTEISIDQNNADFMNNFNNLMQNFLEMNEGKNDFWTNKDTWKDSTFNFDNFFSNMSKFFESDSLTNKHFQFNKDSLNNVIKMFKQMDKEELKEVQNEFFDLKKQMKEMQQELQSIEIDTLKLKKDKSSSKQVIIFRDNSDTKKVNTKDNVHILVDKREKNPDGTIKDKKNVEISFSDNTTKPIHLEIPEINVNKLLPIEIPVPNAKDRNGNKLEKFSFILWIDLDIETYKNLPERIKKQVKPEYDALATTEGAVCGYSPNQNGENYLDIWRTCSGAIENVSASPNPTTGNVNLQFILKENRNVTISINDVFGKKVQDVIVNKRMNKGQNMESFEIKGVEAGMYLIVVQTNAGEQAVHRIIKN